MELLWAHPALGRQVRRRASAFLLGLLLVPGHARGHAGAFILAKCSPDAGGQLSLELSVDYSQHPLLKDRAAAVEAMRQVLRLKTPGGPVALAELAEESLSDAEAPDPELPLPAEPSEAGQGHRLAVLRYRWEPGALEVRFAVPSGNPHDVLFWLGGTARVPGQEVPWRILIAGDETPPVPVPPRAPAWGAAGRGALAAGIAGGLGLLVWWRRARGAAALFG